jgi:hypothetical protein
MIPIYKKPGKVPAISITNPKVASYPTSLNTLCLLFAYPDLEENRVPIE